MTTSETETAQVRGTQQLEWYVESGFLAARGRCAGWLYGQNSIKIGGSWDPTTYFNSTLQWYSSSPSTRFLNKIHSRRGGGFSQRSVSGTRGRQFWIKESWTGPDIFSTGRSSGPSPSSKHHSCSYDSQTYLQENKRCTNLKSIRNVHFFLKKWDSFLYKSTWGCLFGTCKVHIFLCFIFFTRIVQ